MTDNDMNALAAFVAGRLVDDGIDDEWLHEEMPSLVPSDIARLVDALSEISDELLTRAGDRGCEMWDAHQ